MLKVFKQAIDLISINYSGQHSSLTTLYCIMAHYFHNRKKDYTSALKLYTTAMTLAEQLFGDDSLELADIYVDLSRMYLASNRPSEAFKWNSSAQAIYSQHPELKSIKYLIHSANLYCSTHQIKEAESAIAQALNIISRTPAPNPAELLELYQISLELFGLMDETRKRNIVFDKMFDLGITYTEKYTKSCL